MAKLYTALFLLVSCGGVENGSVSVNSPKPSLGPEAPSEVATNFIPKETASEKSETASEESENTPEALVEEAQPTATPQATPSPINEALMTEKKALFDSRFEARINNLLTWDIGQDWASKTDRLDYTFVAQKDYQPAELGSLTSDEENHTWIKNQYYLQGHGPQYICGEVEWTDVTYSELTIVWADDTVSHIRIEIAFYEDMTIKYISLDLQKSTDETEQGWVNQTCN